jgi:hypothetical protein
VAEVTLPSDSKAATRSRDGPQLNISTLVFRNFSTDAEQVLHALFYDSKASREYARDAYLVQTGNIYVVQVENGLNR